MDLAYVATPGIPTLKSDIALVVYIQYATVEYKQLLYVAAVAGKHHHPTTYSWLHLIPSEYTHKQF
jgi:hypothetical protein